MNGMDSMSTLAMRVHRPGRTFPIAVSIIVPVVVSLYILVVLAATGVNTHLNMYYTGYFAHVAGQGGAASSRTCALVCSSASSRSDAFIPTQAIG
jgi:amino acid transporter